MSSVAEQQHHPTKVCTQCNKKCTKVDFAKRQWKNQHPICRLCTEAANNAPEQKTTKKCAQCNKDCDKEQFPTKQWKKEQPLCRLCYELSRVSEDDSRICFHCNKVQPRDQYNFHQWGRGNEALCHNCRANYENKAISRIGKGEGPKDLPDGTMVCNPHSLECCDTCMVDYRLPNRFALKRAALGRDLTNAECDKEMEALYGEINRKVCIMDGLPMCPRSGRKLRCPCNEVTYCSKDCQRHHWTIHKMTCKDHAKKVAAKKEASKQSKTKMPAKPSHGLTEAQLNYIRIEAFWAENSGKEHSIEECAWQLGEHPFVIGGGSVQMTANGEKFVKGDVAKIYKEKCGTVWDGSPRFGMGPYVQQKPYFDLIGLQRLDRVSLRGKRKLKGF